MFGALPIGLYPFGGAPLAPALPTPTMARIAVLSPRDSDLAVMTATSQVATLPVTNVQTMPPKRVWRTSTTEAAVNIAFRQPIAANMLAIKHMLGQTGVLRVRLAHSLADVESAPGMDTGWRSAYPVTGQPQDPELVRFTSALMWENDTLYPFCRVDIADPAAPGGYLDIGRLAVGRYWQPTTNFDLSGVPLGYDQRDVQTATEYGETFTDRRPAPRRFSLEIGAADRDEVLNGIAEIRRLRGLWGDVFVFLDPNATTHFHRHSMQGVFTSPQEHQMVREFTVSGEAWSVAFPLRELI